MSGTTDVRITCPGCGGTRVQRNNDGVWIRCPVCGGSGYIYSEPGLYVTY